MPQTENQSEIAISFWNNVDQENTSFLFGQQNISIKSLVHSLLKGQVTAKEDACFTSPMSPMTPIPSYLVSS